MSEPWAFTLILGPIILLVVFIYVWSRNRAARKERGDAALGTTNAVRGSEEARPDIEAEAARAERGDSTG